MKSHILAPEIKENLALQSVKLDPIQLHLNPLPATDSVNLAPMDLDPDTLDPEEDIIEEVKPQLDSDIPNPEDDPADVPTQTLWEQAKASDKFALQVLKAL